ncbi:MAG: EamA family transporter [Burkholderiaceae bacterium]
MRDRYFIQLVGLSAVWGGNFLFTRIASPQLGPSLTAATRVFLGALTLGLIMRHLKMRWPTEHWRELLLLGGIGIAGPHFLYSLSSLYLPAGYSAILSITSVLFGAVVSSWLHEDTLTPARIVGCVVAFAGMLLVVRLGPIHPSPQLMAAAFSSICGSALSGSVAPLLKRATSRMEPLAVTASIHAGAFLWLLPFALWSVPHAHFTASALGSVAAMGIVTSGLAYWLYMRIVQKVSPVAALSSTFMITIFGVFWGHVVLRETFTSASYAGCVLVLVATLLVAGVNPLRRFVRRMQ